MKDVLFVEKMVSSERLSQLGGSLTVLPTEQSLPDPSFSSSKAIWPRGPLRSQA